MNNDKLLVGKFLKTIRYFFLSRIIFLLTYKNTVNKFDLKKKYLT